jgi:biotin carboxyl carrier protein
MNYQVKIGERTFNVDIIDLHARPVVAVVDGTEVEVWPHLEEGETKIEGTKNVDSVHSKEKVSMASNGRETSRKPTAQEQPRELVSVDNVVKAPIPGTIQTIFVQPGDEVLAGQELFCL